MASGIVSYLSGLDTVEILAVLLLPVVLYIVARPKWQQLPLINGRKTFEFSDSASKQRYLRDAPQMIKAGLRKVYLNPLYHFIPPSQ